ncbi:hypothetical protein LHFGNBLO_006574 (plasmid) [Mesorhizobium sp. AR10]|uniref:hypothetical protein n=1 Tax=Mesorhizobium sp. AR10 TaxID=2865839 RepID=UPI00215F067D|nr:hypothetical protein [Mesorhizobium sp. AR10]UVK35712.1 hypothetical protein LHFGNBLO_006574 [Mesorhizobium sp. AR10]
MSAQSANVVSLDAFRHARNAQQLTRPPEALFMMPGMVPMAWVPVWFMPVYPVGTPSTQN